MQCTSGRATWALKVLAADVGGGAGGNGRTVASLDGGGIGHPSCSPKGRVIQHCGIEVDQSLTHSVVDLVEIAEAQLIDGEVFVHE